MTPSLPHESATRPIPAQVQRPEITPAGAIRGVFRESKGAMQAEVAIRGDTAGMPDVIRFTPDVADAILGFGAIGSSSVRLGSGSGECHAYVLHFEPSG